MKALATAVLLMTAIEFRLMRAQPLPPVAAVKTNIQSVDAKPILETLRDAVVRASSERTDKRAMVGYNVYRNNERLCVAGVGDFGVLTAGAKMDSLPGRPLHARVRSQIPQKSALKVDTSDGCGLKRPDGKGETIGNISG